MAAMNTVTVVYEPCGSADFERTAGALAGRCNVIVNLDYVASLQTADVRRLIEMARQSSDAGTDFALRATRPDVLKMLQMTALDRVFTVIGPEAA
jgi:anti-anti-sigma factor